MNDYDQLLKLQSKRAKLAEQLRVLDEKIRALVIPMREAMKLPPGRPVGGQRGSVRMDQIITVAWRCRLSAIVKLATLQRASQELRCRSETPTSQIQFAASMISVPL